MTRARCTSARRPRRGRARGVPAPPTFTFAAPYWSAFRADEQPPDPTGGAGNPMHSIMGELFAKGALVLHGEQEFTYHRTPVAGDVLDGLQTITDIYEKETDSARHDVRRHGDGVVGRARPVAAGRDRALQSHRPSEEVGEPHVGRLDDKVAIITGAGPGHRARVRGAVPRRGREGRRGRGRGGARGRRDEGARGQGRRDLRARPTSPTPTPRRRASTRR